MLSWLIPTYSLCSRGVRLKLYLLYTGAVTRAEHFTPWNVKHQYLHMINRLHSRSSWPQDDDKTAQHTCLTLAILRYKRVSLGGVLAAPVAEVMVRFRGWSGAAIWYMIKATEVGGEGGDRHRGCAACTVQRWGRVWRQLWVRRRRRRRRSTKRGCTSFTFSSFWTSCNQEAHFYITLTGRHLGVWLLYEVWQHALLQHFSQADCSCSRLFNTLYLINSRSLSSLNTPHRFWRVLFSVCVTAPSIGLSAYLQHLFTPPLHDANNTYGCGTEIVLIILTRIMVTWFPFTKKTQ